MLNAEESGKPNIILIMCDDMGYEGLSVYGSQSYRTPHLDQLAATGMLFHHCYSQPICTPSRVQIMTGKYNFRNYTRFGELRTDQFTFGNVLKRAGYKTGIFGKWQLGGDDQTVREFGFDEQTLWNIQGRESRYWNPRLLREGKLVSGLAEEFGPEIVCDDLVKFIKKHHSDPFFVYYPMMLPHWPFIPTPDSPAGGSRQRSGKYDGKNGGVEYFDDMIAYLDKNVGRIVNTLEEHKLREKTLILFTCDNGCATNIISKMKGFSIHGGKGTMPDAGTHVALIANWPGVIRANSESRSLVDFTDLLPTLADVGNARLPKKLQLDGRSFYPQLKGEPGSPREWVFCHYTRNGVPKEPANEAQKQALLKKQQQAKQKKMMGRYVRNQQFKLYEDGRFYDVSRDRLEEQAIAVGTGDADAEAIRMKFQSVLDGMPPWISFQKARATRKKKSRSN